MAVTINVGFSRKVGEPNYGSRGASLHLELEIDRSSLDEPEGFQSQIEGLFERAREAVDRELQRDASPSSESHGSSERPSDQESHNGCRQAPRPATPNQIRAIHTIARHRGVDLSPLLDASFGGKGAEELSIVEASLLIDQLQSLPATGDGDLTWVS
jgi:hypothetical protein